MPMKIDRILKLILPNKKINILVIIIVLLGVTSGALFTTIIGLNDQNLVIDKIKLFIDNIDNNNLVISDVFRNSIYINLTYTILVIIFGISIVGVVLVLGLLFLKSFIIGFSCAGIILTYQYKGIILALLYVIFGELINLIAVILIAIYNIMLAFKIANVIFKHNYDLKHFFKSYAVIGGIVLILNLLAALSETFILPSLIKLVIKLYL